MNMINIFFQFISHLYNELKSFIIDYHEAIYPQLLDDCDYKNPYNALSTSTFFTNFFNIFFTKQDNENENEKVVENKKIYDDKYDTKYNNLEAIELNKYEIDMLPNKYIMEYTPLGNVIMYFDYDKKSFQYYSDFSIPYKFLECVSKKFCIINKNKVYREIKMVVDENEFSIVRNSSSSLQNKSKSFAKLKSYNNSNPSIKGVPSMKHSELKIIQKDIVRYTHLGKISNFSFIKNTTPKFKAISYKDFIKTNNKIDDWVLY